MSRVIIVNQSTFHPKYESIDTTSRETWGSQIIDDVDILNYYAAYDSEGEPIEHKFGTNPPLGEDKRVGNVLLQGVRDWKASRPRRRGEDTRLLRFIRVLEYCVDNYEFDYIYRTGCTSYIDIKKLLKYLDKVPKEKVYAGSAYCESHFPWFMSVKGKPKWKCSFVAGFHCLMSRDVVEFAVKNKKLLEEIDATEDVSFGMLVTTKGGYIKEEEFCKEDRGTWHSYRKQIAKMGYNFKIERNGYPYLFNHRFGKGDVFAHYMMELHKMLT